MRIPLVLIVALMVSSACSRIGGQTSPAGQTSHASPIASATESPSLATPLLSPTAAATLNTTPAASRGFVPPDEAMQMLFQCGLIGRVAAYFRIPNGNTIWDHFPGMGLAPELEGTSALFVAVYDGEVSGLFSGQPGASRAPLMDALCVFEEEGDRNIYANVSREGMALPPGAYVAAADEWLLPTPPS